MSKRALRGLRASIKHWEKQAEVEATHEVAIGQGHCALCKLYHPTEKNMFAIYTGHNLSCGVCPVRRKTEKNFCEGSPFNAAYKAFLRWENGVGRQADWRKAARREVTFLKSLLP